MGASALGTRLYWATFLPAEREKLTQQSTQLTRQGEESISLDDKITLLISCFALAAIALGLQQLFRGGAGTLGKYMTGGCLSGSGILLLGYAAHRVVETRKKRAEEIAQAYEAFCGENIFFDAVAQALAKGEVRLEHLKPVDGDKFVGALLKLAVTPAHLKGLWNHLVPELIGMSRQDIILEALEKKLLSPQELTAIFESNDTLVPLFFNYVGAQWDTIPESTRQLLGKSLNRRLFASSIDHNCDQFCLKMLNLYRADYSVLVHWINGLAVQTSLVALIDKNHNQMHLPGLVNLYDKLLVGRHFDLLSKVLEVDTDARRRLTFIASNPVIYPHLARLYCAPGHGITTAERSLLVAMSTHKAIVRYLLASREAALLPLTRAIFEVALPGTIPLEGEDLGNFFATHTEPRDSLGRRFKAIAILPLAIYEPFLAPIAHFGLKGTLLEHLTNPLMAGRLEYTAENIPWLYTHLVVDRSQPTGLSLPNLADYPQLYGVHLTQLSLIGAIEALNALTPPQRREILRNNFALDEVVDIFIKFYLSCGAKAAEDQEGARTLPLAKLFGIVRTGDSLTKFAQAVLPHAPSVYIQEFRRLLLSTPHYFQCLEAFDSPETLGILEGLFRDIDGIPEVDLPITIFTYYHGLNSYSRPIFLSYLINTKRESALYIPVMRVLCEAYKTGKETITPGEANSLADVEPDFLISLFEGGGDPKRWWSPTLNTIYAIMYRMPSARFPVLGGAMFTRLGEHFCSYFQQEIEKTLKAPAPSASGGGVFLAVLQQHLFPNFKVGHKPEPMRRHSITLDRALVGPKAPLVRRNSLGALGNTPQRSTPVRPSPQRAMGERVGGGVGLGDLQPRSLSSAFATAGLPPLVRRAAPSSLGEHKDAFGSGPAAPPADPLK